MTRKLIAVDLLCGAGGWTTGMIMAAESLGYEIEMHGVNHDPKAIQTISRNHPNGQYYCEDIEVIKPEKVLPGRYADFLMASPECIFFSRARGGLPKNDQSRAIAWAITNWCQRITIPTILIENVPEFVDWGPLYPDCNCGLGLKVAPEKHPKTCHWLKPIPSKKGKLFVAWINSLKACGYTVQWKILNCADYGDPTTRQRFFLLGRRGHKIHWPEPTHSKNIEPRLFGAVKPWRTAREIIDWSLPGESIFNRKKPLAENTIKRIFAGLIKYSEIMPFVIGQQSNAAPRSVDEPVPTVAGAGAISLVDPYIVKLYGTSTTASVEEPLSAITAEGEHLGLAQPFVLSVRGGKDGYTRASEINAPVPTVTTVPALYLVEPKAFIIGAGGPQGSARPQSIDEPLDTVLTENHRALVEPFVITYHGTGPDGRERTRSIEDPLPTVLGSPIYGLATPFIVTTNHGPEERAHSVDKPMPTVTSVDAFGMIQPYLVNYNGTGTAHSVDEPVPTVTTNDRLALVCLLRDGRRALVDIRFRMFQPHELAAAQGFPDQYWFAGKRKDKVKLIGNAVPIHTAMALCLEQISRLEVV